MTPAKKKAPTAAKPAASGASKGFKPPMGAGASSGAAKPGGFRPPLAAKQPASGATNTLGGVKIFGGGKKGGGEGRVFFSTHRPSPRPSGIRRVGLSKKVSPTNSTEAK